MSIEDLLNVKVVTANKTPQRLSDTAAAVFVISHDDIHRSGATNVPELLRLVPGVEVAWIGGEAYSVTIRGFSGRFANKLLVLQDGRSLYTSFFAGVFWESELPLLEDIERIEVIRGPGAAVWGANAVNGVINIITRSARETDGGIAGFAGGTDSQREGFARYGLALNDAANLRFYARSGEAPPGQDPDGNDAAEVVRHHAAGLRFDAEGDAGRLSVQSEFHGSYSGQSVLAPIPDPPYVTVASESLRVSGGYAIARYETRLPAGNELAMQLDYTHDRVLLPSLIDEHRDVVSFDVEDHVRIGSFNDAAIGASVTTDSDRIEGSALLSFDPPSLTRRSYSLRAQDEIALLGNRLRLTAGAILEDDSIAGTHFMPDARIAFNPTSNSTLWAAVSHALRLPSRAEQNVTFLLGPTIPAQPPYLPLPVIPTAVGSTQFGTESELAYQAGLRLEITPDLSVDLAAFISHYANLRTDAINPQQIMPAQLGGAPYLDQPVDIVNGQHAMSRGSELAIDWRVTEWWRLVGNVSSLSVATNPATDSEGIRTNSPRFEASLRSQTSFNAWRFDLTVRRVDALNLIGVETVPAYTALDARLAWSPCRALELSFGGKNLTDSAHLEYVSDNLQTQPRLTDRMFYTAFEVKF